MNINELKSMSIDFRRITSNMLSPNLSNATVNLMRFKKYIDSNEHIYTILSEKFEGVDYDFRQCYQFETSGWNTIEPPTDEAEHLKAIYDYIEYICDEERDVSNVALGYPHGSRKIIDITRSFLSSFKPLVDYIIDSLSKEICIATEERTMGITQKIENNYGTVNAAANGDITSSNIINELNSISEINKLLNSFSQILSQVQMNEEDKEDILDDIETIYEQVNSKEPKVSRLREGLQNVKNFVSTSANLIPQVLDKMPEINELIEKVGTFISNQC